MNNLARCHLLTAVVLLIVINLSACSGSNRAGDVASLPADVPVEASPPPAPPAPASSPTALLTPTQEPPATLLPAMAEPAANTGPALIFSVSGGLMGFCDTLTVSATGEYTFDICAQESYSGVLAEPDKVSLQTWVKNLADFQLTFEDNPGGPDNLKTEVLFAGVGQIAADENQQQVILDWASGLAFRLRPQPATPELPTPGPVTVGDQGICPNIARPALLTLIYDNPTSLILLDPTSQATCDIPLAQPPLGRIVPAGGSIFYPVFDSAAKTVSVWQLNPQGAHQPLAFTAIPMAEPGPYDFVVSEDGAKIAWGYTLVNSSSDPPVYTNSLWLANIDGSSQTAVLNQVANNEARFVAPVRFARDGNIFYYALQPDSGGPIFSGRLDTLYSSLAAGGASQLLYACPPENPACIGGLSADGGTLAVMQPAAGVLQILNREGALINSLPLPATDYTERVAFSPAGNMAFVTASLAQADQNSPPLPNPGYISLITPPYAGQPQTLLTANTISTLLGWLDDNRLTFGTIDADGNTATSLLTLDGQVTPLLSGSQVAVGAMR